MIISLVVAAAANDVIGRDGALPWHLPADLRRFRAITTGHVVVMGRLTYESILARLGRPLPDRTSVVITRGPAETRGLPGVVTADCVERALAVAATLAREAGDEEFFVIGGASVYARALASVDRIYLTRLHRDVTGDAEMPAGWLDGFEVAEQERLPGEEPGGGYSFITYRRAGT